MLRLLRGKVNAGRVAQHSNQSLAATLFTLQQHAGDTVKRLAELLLFVGK
jgi:hypothetical protein